MTQHVPLKPSDSDDFPLLRGVKHIRPELMLITLLEGYKGTPMIFFDSDGNILLINGFAAFSYQRTSEELIGMNWRDIVPREWAEERIGLIGECISSEKPLLLMQVSNGRRILLRFNPIRTQVGDEHPSCVLVTGDVLNPSDYESVMRLKADDEQMYHSEYIDLGPLDVLSTREIEVLAMMRQGMRTKEIAKHLCRSVSTIENHRDSIGSKLGLKDRSEIIEMANTAVLQVEDANRNRVVVYKTEVDRKTYPYGHQDVLTES